MTPPLLALAFLAVVALTMVAVSWGETAGTPGEVVAQIRVLDMGMILGMVVLAAKAAREMFRDRTPQNGTKMMLEFLRKESDSNIEARHAIRDSAHAAGLKVAVIEKLLERLEDRVQGIETRVEVIMRRPWTP